MSKALADANKLTETTKKYLKGLSLVEKLYPEYVPPTLLAETPFPYSIENRTLFFIGPAGSGKSQGIKELIFNVCNRKCRDKLEDKPRKKRIGKIDPQSLEEYLKEHPDVPLSVLFGLKK